MQAPSPDSDNQAFQIGREARIAGIARMENPHTERDPDSIKMWNAGWDSIDQDKAENDAGALASGLVRSHQEW
jgi:hypothetical protein